MPIRLAVHVGPHKTGSTSVQQALVTYRDQLAACGVWYPPSIEDAEFPDQHADIATMLIRAGVEPVVEWLLAAREEATRRRCDTLFLSSENFRGPTIRRQLVTAMGRFRQESGGDARLLYVRRDPLELARSQVMARLDGELGFFFRERYDLRAWAADFLHQQRNEERFFARHGARFLQLEAVPPAALAAELLHLATDRDHGYVVTGRANVTSARLSGPPAAMQAYGLRVMQRIIGGQPIVGTTAAKLVAAAAAFDDDQYPGTLAAFEVAVRRAVTAGFADAAGETIWSYRWRLLKRHLAELRRLW